MEDKRGWEAVVVGENFVFPLHRHFITIMCLDEGEAARAASAGDPALYNFSAFVVELHGRWFAVTAGHIFDALVQAVAGGSVLTNWMIDDSAVSNSGFPSQRIFLDIEKDVHYFHDFPVEGMDYAVFPLAELTRLALEKEKIAAIKPCQWDADGISDFSHWMVVGTPMQLATLKFGAPIEKFIVTIPLERCDLPPHMREKEYQNLHALLRYDLVESEHGRFEIDGVSGGPVFAVKMSQTEIADYRLLGIQSSVVGDIVSFCAAQPFLDSIATAFSEVSTTS